MLLVVRRWKFVLREAIEICEDNPLNVGGQTTSGYVSEKTEDSFVTVNNDANVNESAKAKSAAIDRLMPAPYLKSRAFFVQLEPPQ